MRFNCVFFLNVFMYFIVKTSMLKNAKLNMIDILFHCNVFLQCLSIKMCQGRQNVKWNMFNKYKNIHQRAKLKLRKIYSKCFIKKSPPITSIVIQPLVWCMNKVCSFFNNVSVCQIYKVKVCYIII